jgi:hypothetical protein
MTTQHCPHWLDIVMFVGLQVVAFFFGAALRSLWIWIRGPKT